MRNEIKKLKVFINLSWFTLFAIWIFCFITGERLYIIVDQQPLRNIFNFIDNNLWLDIALSFITYYANTIFVYYAILKQKIYSYKPIILSFIIFIFWLLKTIFMEYELSNYIDFLTIGILIIFIPRKWYRAVIGIFLVLIFTLISSEIKGISIINYEEILNNSSSINYISFIDIITMSILYYLYSRKEVYNKNEILSIFWKKQKVENYKHCFRKCISRCTNYYHYITSNFIEFYCSLIFAIIVYGSILIVGILFNRYIEATISVIAFHIFRRLDEDKTFHAETHIKCWFVSMVSFLTLMKLSLPLAQSILLNILLAYCLSQVMYYVQDYLDNKILIKHYEKKLNLLSINKCLNNLTLEEMQKLMPHIEFDKLKIVYEYLHRNKETNGTDYAYKNNIGEATLYRYLKQVNKTYQDLCNNLNA